MLEPLQLPAHTQYMYICITHSLHAYITHTTHTVHIANELHLSTHTVQIKQTNRHAHVNITYKHTKHIIFMAVYDISTDFRFTWTDLDSVVCVCVG